MNPNESRTTRCNEGMSLTPASCAHLPQGNSTCTCTDENTNRPPVHLRPQTARDGLLVSGSSHKGHSYHDTAISGSSRVHFGDNHTSVVNNNYGTSDEQTEQERWTEFLKALSFERMDFRLAAITPAQGDTCRWVFSRPEYLRWRDPKLRGTHGGLLWIKGKAGVGKSTIMRCILENSTDSMPDHHIISFFFNARGQPLERSVEGMYRSLLTQLLEKVPRLQQVITLPRFSIAGQKWEPDVLQDIFRKAVLGLQQERLVVIVDALDEGDQAGVRAMVEYLESLTEAAQTKNIYLEACYASRHYPHITARSCESMVIEDRPEHAQDIHYYISNNLKVTRGSLRDDLRLGLVKKSQAVFLWVVLVVRRLNEAFDDGAGRTELFEVLVTVPDDLNDLLHDIVVKGSKDPRLVPAVVWMLVARYTLNIREFYFAIQLGLQQAEKLDMVDWCRHSDDLEIMRRFVLSASKGLIEVTSSETREGFVEPGAWAEDDFYKYEDGKFDHWQVQFIHETVRDYFLAGGLAGLRPDLQPDVVAKSHALVAEWCKLWIRSTVAACVHLPGHQSSGLIDTSLLNRVLMSKSTYDWTRFPLLGYVRHSTLGHLDAAHTGNAIAVEDLQDFPIKQWINIMNIGGWLALNSGADDVEGIEYQQSTSLLYCLLEEGLSALAESYLEVLAGWYTKRDMGRYLNVQCGGEHFSCLGAAAYHGFDEIVALLLEYGADTAFPDEPDCINGSALSQAVYGDHGAIVWRLLDHSADPNGENHYYGRPLVTAAVKGNHEIMELLLDRGASFDDGRVSSHSTFSHALSLRAKEDPERSFRLLLERGARVTAEEASELLSLWINHSTTNHRLLVTFLELGAHPDVAMYGRQAIHAVAVRSEGSQAIAAMQALFDAGADINAVDSRGRTALILASSRGKDEVVRFLLNLGADVNIRSKDLGTAIEAARSAKNEGRPYDSSSPSTLLDTRNIIAMLLEAGVRDYRQTAGWMEFSTMS